ncbi:Endonuclease/exonuclease/phosphatase [Blastocladiella britannica]|nr:Endonuclease/exonuclease/phosphatase [Blastocladiella britannica]
MATATKKKRSAAQARLDSGVNTNDNNNDTAAAPIDALVSEFAHLPNNSALPEEFDATPVPADHLKLVTLNVAGWNAAVKKGLDRLVSIESPDVLFLQETKLSSDPNLSSTESLVAYPHCYYSHCKTKKGYSGTACFSRVEPTAVHYGFGPDHRDSEGRVIALHFPTLAIVSAYVPNAGAGLKRLEVKTEWVASMKAYLAEIQASGKRIVYCGDLNVAHTELDLARPKTNHKTAGFTPSERTSFTDLLESLALVDVWRHQHPEEVGFTYYGFRWGARTKRLGWRLDYFVVSQGLLAISSAATVAADDQVSEPQANPVVEEEATPTPSRVVGPCVIRDDLYGVGDHVPVVLVLPRSLVQ